MNVARYSRVVIFVVIAACGLPRAARAQGFAGAGLGVSFGSDATTDGRADFTAAVGWLPREPLGVELDLTYAPDFFKNPGGFSDNRLVTVMANVLVAPSDRNGRGGRGGYGRRRQGGSVRPYFSGGFGVMAERLGMSAPGDVFSTEHLGVDAGIGIMALPHHAFGIRIDARYFQDLIGTGHTSSTSGIDFGSFHFWRASIGLVGTF